MKHEATARLVIDVPKARAWELLQDLSIPHHYVPGLTGSEITSEKRSGVGASRRVYRKTGGYLDETVNSWQDGVGFVLRLHRGAKGPGMPFSEAQFRYRIEDAGSGTTALTVSLLCTLRWGALGRFLYSRLLYRIFRHVVHDIALSAKRYYETGEPVSQDALRQLKLHAKRGA